jgi:CDP-paratose 2-epimerase
MPVSASKRPGVILVTGSSGLIGSEVVRHFAARGFSIAGIDGNLRPMFFGPDADNAWNLDLLSREVPSYQHYSIDIRSRDEVSALVAELRPSALIHTAAQPSHEFAAIHPLQDFDVNAVGTINLLEAARLSCPESPFVHMSTNKVYGDLLNTIALRELDLRWDYDDPRFVGGIPESFSIDQSQHSLLGASKLAADVMVQEYGRYFGMPTCCLRCGCLSGPSHSGVEMHGFLSYLVRCNIEDREYRVFGYKGKQVRDNLHAEDVASLIFAFFQQPRCGEVYNLGGGKSNSCSILEAFRIVEGITGKAQRYKYIEENRKGDHICYYSDLRKTRCHFPDWAPRKSLTSIIREIYVGWARRLATHS